ncbi:MAG: peptidoglycan editing factor PgeF [Gammaproteobacteria bacterium]
MLNFLTPNWPAPKHIRAYTTLRTGGCSEGPYASFNLSGRENDPAVPANRELLKQQLGYTLDPIWISQVHGTQAVLAEENRQTSPEADAVYTRTTGLPALILTADCLPVLICNKEGSEVAAIHAGWKGLLAGVIEATIMKLQSSPDQLMAWLGPAIGPQYFEVGPEVRDAFVQKSAESAAAFAPYNSGRWLADIYQLARQRLAQCRVARVYGGEYCTYADSEKFYSFRRDQGVTGRMASLIWIH